MVPRSSCIGRDPQFNPLQQVGSSGSISLWLNMQKGPVGLKGLRETGLIPPRSRSGMTIIKPRASHTISLPAPIPYLPNNTYVEVKFPIISLRLRGDTFYLAPQSRTFLPVIVELKSCLGTKTCRSTPQPR